MTTVCPHVRSTIPSLKLGEYVLVQADKPCSSQYFLIASICFNGAKTRGFKHTWNIRPFEFASFLQQNRCLLTEHYKCRSGPNRGPTPSEKDLNTGPDPGFEERGGERGTSHPVFERERREDLCGEACCGEVWGSCPKKN